MTDGAPPEDARTQPPDIQGGCDAIELGAASQRFRAWDGDGAGTVRLAAGGGCPPLSVSSAPAWLAVDLEPGAMTLRLSGDLPVGRQVGEVILQDAQGNTRSLGATLEHFARGPGRQPKVLVYAIGGLAAGDPLPTVTSWLFTHARMLAGAAAPGGTDTSEASAWASLLTGVEPARHRVGEPPARVGEPTFPARARAGHPTTLASAWAPMEALVEPEVGVITGDFDGAVAHVLARLQETDRDLFVLAGEGPAAARRAGRPIDEALRAADAGLDRLLSAVVARPTFSEEDWLIVVAGVPNAGGMLPLAFARPGQAPGMLFDKASLLDVAPTVLKHLGITLQPGWQLPGFLGGGETEGDCADGRDDDGDGRFDCRDEDCGNACDYGCMTHDAGYRRGRLAEADVSDLRIDHDTFCGSDLTPGLAVRWTAPADDLYLFHSDGSGIDSVVYLRDRDCAGEERGCGEDLYFEGGAEPGGLLLEASAGESYVLFSDAEFVRDFGRLELQIYGRRTECEGAIDLGNREGRVAEGNNRGAATRLAPDFGADLCNGVDPPPGAYDTLFRWRAPRAGRWRFTTEGSNFDTILRIFRGPCSDFAPRACSDDVDPGDILHSQLDLDLDAGADLIIVVSGFWHSGPGNDGDRGDYVLGIVPAQ